jgi:hypothetical protein
VATSTAQQSRSHATRTIVSDGELRQLGDSENLRLQTRAAPDWADRAVDPAYSLGQRLVDLLRRADVESGPAEALRVRRSASSRVARTWHGSRRRARRCRRPSRRHRPGTGLLHPAAARSCRQILADRRRTGSGSYGRWPSHLQGLSQLDAIGPSGTAARQRARLSCEERLLAGLPCLIRKRNATVLPNSTASR